MKGVIFTLPTHPSMMPNLARALGSGMLLLAWSVLGSGSGSFLPEVHVGGEFQQQQQYWQHGQHEQPPPSSAVGGCGNFPTRDYSDALEHPTSSAQMAVTAPAKFSVLFGTNFYGGFSATVINVMISRSIPELARCRSISELTEFSYLCRSLF